MPEDYEEIGVVLSLDRKGRTNAARVFLNDGKVVKREVITSGRNGSKALEEALRSLGLVLHDAGRGTVCFAQPEAAKLLLDHSK